MMLFWTLTAVMIAAALAILAPALLRRQQTKTLDRDGQNITIAKERLAELDAELSKGLISEEDHANSKLELEQALLQDLDAASQGSDKVVSTSGTHGKFGLLALVILIPLLSVLLYQQLGMPGMIALDSASRTTANSEGASPIGSMSELATKLRQRLEEGTPNDAEGWFLLGRTYMSMQDYQQAAQAFDKTYQLASDQPAVMLALADALIMTQQGDTSGRPAELVAKALAMEPENTTALWMSGLIAEQRGDFTEALRLWGTLNPLLADSPQDQQQLAIQIARVSTKAGIEPPTVAAAPVDQAGSTTDTFAGKVRLKVSLSPSLQQQTNAKDTVFVYAKAMNGPRFPLAAARYSVSDLPLEITLDDSTAVMTTAKLSDFPLVKVGARVSSSGDATAQSGDLIGERTDIKVGTEEVVEVVIDGVQP